MKQISESSLSFYNKTLKNHCFDNLTFKNAYKDYDILKKLKKSKNIIKCCFTAIIFYIRYNAKVGLKYNLDKIDINKYPFIIDNSKINPNISNIEYKKIIRNYSRFLSKINNNIDVNHIIETVNWNEILKNKEEIYDTLNPKHQLLVDIYTLIPPRRIIDYQLMYYINNPELDIDDNKNYCLYDEKNDEVKLIFNNYKTKKFFHKQCINLKSKPLLSEKIKNYIKTNDIQINTLLFNIKNPNSFRCLIQKLLKYKVNDLRHSYIDYIYEKNYSPEKLKKISLLMAHTLEQQNSYRTDIKL
jgi:hypothetical protein